MELRDDEVRHALGAKLSGVEDDSGHRNYSIYVDGLLIGKASISHSWRKLDASLIGRVARQIYISVREFYEMSKCTKDKTWYDDKMRRDGRV